MLRSLSLIGIMILGLIPRLALAQNVHPDFVDGKLYLKVLENGTELPWQADGKLVPALAQEYPALAQVLSEYGTVALFKPFKTQAAILQSTYELHFTEAEDALVLMEELMQLEFVEYAERVPLYTLDHTPNDLQNNQWGLFQIQAEDAWDISTGDPNTVVAIVDDAVLQSHQDLTNLIYTNPGEIPNDGIDNDGNGFIDDVNGYDLADQDNNANPPAGATNGAFTHGTHVAGIVSAESNNGVGVASIGYGCTLLPVKVKEDATIGSPSLQATVTGMDYAVVMDADVVNMSFGGAGFSQTTQNVINVGAAQGMVWVASAGNDGSLQARYPAAYANVISVGSTTTNDVKSGFSNYHQTVDVMAPGSGIYSCLAGSPTSYGNQSGTSMSSPMAAGLCALMKSVNPQLSPQDLEQCLKQTCDNIDAQNPSYVGFMGAGRINAYNALVCVPRAAVPAAGFFHIGDTVCGGVIAFTDTSSGFPQNWFWDFGDGNTGSGPAPSHAYTQSGTYTVTLIASNNVGADTVTGSVTVTVIPAPNALAGPDSTVCWGDTVWLNATGGDFYQWLPGTGISDPNTPDPYLVVTSSVTYFLKVTNANGCIDWDTMAISVAPLPGIWAGNDRTITQGDSVQLEAIGGSTYEWSPAAGLSCTTCPNPKASPAVTTTYTARGYNQAGCFREDDMTVTVMPVSIDEAMVNRSVVYPNPAGDYFYLESELPAYGMLEVALYDLRGRRVMDIFRGEADAGAWKKRVNRPGQLAGGTYWVVWTAQGRRWTQQLMLNQK